MKDDEPTTMEWETPATGKRMARWTLVLAIAGLILIAVVAVSWWWEDDEPATLPILEDDPEVTPPPIRSMALQSIGSFEAISPGPLKPRWLHAMAWTGICPKEIRPPACGEIIVWGGVSADGQPLLDGAAYNPDLDRWRPIADAPRSPLKYHALPSVWTGTAPGSVSGQVHGGELIIWGFPEEDRDGPGDGRRSAGGLAFDPVQDEWRQLPPAPIAPRVDHSLTWTGSEVIVWGGRSIQATGAWQPRSDGAAYDPKSNSWRSLPQAPLEPRWGHAGVSLPDGAIVWGGAAPAGGRGGARTLVDGAVYDAIDDRWRLLSPFPVEGALATAPPPPATGELTDKGLVVSPPFPDDHGRQLLARHPLTRDGQWHLISDVPMQQRRGSRVVTIGNAAIVLWGSDLRLPNGALLSVSDVLWHALPPAETPAGLGEAVVWTGGELLVWGGGNLERPRRIAYAFHP